jgi:hypothetical protein
MKPMKTTAWMFATAWFVIAAIQSYRSFGRCPVTSGWTAALWSLHVTMLLMPPAGTVVRLREPRDELPGLALLTYVPVAIAMRLWEMCGTPGGP